MANDTDQLTLSPTVLQVIEQFVAAIRADAVIPDDENNRLGQLLRKGAVPKPEDLNAALFESPVDGTP